MWHLSLAPRSNEFMIYKKFAFINIIILERHKVMTKKSNTAHYQTNIKLIFLCIYTIEQFWLNTIFFGNTIHTNTMFSGHHNSYIQVQD